MPEDSLSYLLPLITFPPPPPPRAPITLPDDILLLIAECLVPAYDIHIHGRHHGYTLDNIPDPSASPFRLVSRIFQRGIDSGIRTAYTGHLYIWRTGCHALPEHFPENMHWVFKRTTEVTLRNAAPVAYRLLTPEVIPGLRTLSVMTSDVEVLHNKRSAETAGKVALAYVLDLRRHVVGVMRIVKRIGELYGAGGDGTGESTSVATVAATADFRAYFHVCMKEATAVRAQEDAEVWVSVVEVTPGAAPSVFRNYMTTRGEWLAQNGPVL